MKTHIATLMQKMHFWNLFIGLVVGFGLGVVAINALVPDADQLVRMYRIDQNSVRTDSMMMSHNAHNPYMMRTVTSEKQFVEDMILHHEAAVTMAQQVLALHPRADIQKLAEDIVSAQTKEIDMMKGWLANWK